MDLTDISKLGDWEAPKSWLKISTLDIHTGGEPLRIISDGFPALEGTTVLEKRSYVREHYDHLRTSLMWEPRGHSDMYGAIIVEPNSPEADFGVIFMHNEGYSTGCGHAVIALAKVFVETGLIPMNGPITPVVMDVPSGRIHAEVLSEKGKVTGARFRNIPSFVQHLDNKVDVPELGPVKVDIAFGGAFYAYVDTEQIKVDCSPENVSNLIEAGMAIKKVVSQSVEMDHPAEPEMNYLYGTIFVGKSDSSDHHSRHVCIFADGQVDRCPTGTGVSGRLAILHAKDEIKKGQMITIDSILGTTFTGQIINEVKVGKYDGVIPEVGGNAYITGRQTFFVDPDDPLKDGFILR